MSFCSLCGQKVNPDDKFCMGCGQTLGANSIEKIAISETAAGSENETLSANTNPPISAPLPTKRFSRKAGLVTVMVLIVVVALALVYGLFLNKTPKDLYFSSEIKTFMSAINGIQERYGDDLTFQQALMQSPSQTNQEIYGDFNLGASMSSYKRDQMNTIKQTLKNSKITILTSSDPRKQISDTVVSLVLKGSNLINSEFVLSKEQVGVKVPVLYDKYLWVNPNNFGEAARKIDAKYSGPEKLDLSQFDLKNLTLKKEDWRKIGLKYAKFIDSNLSEEFFTIQKGVAYDSPDGEQKLRQLTLKMNDVQTKEFFNKLIDELYNDSEMQDLLANNIADMTILSSLTGNTNQTNSTEVKKEVKNNLEQLKNNFKSTKFPDGLTMVVIIDGKGNIVSRQFALTAVDGDNNDGLSINIDSKNWDSKGIQKTSTVNMVLKPTNEKDSAFTLNLDTDTTLGKDGIKDRFTGSSILTDRGRKTGDISLNVSTLYSPQKDNKRQLNSDFELLTSGNFESIIPIKGKINRAVDQNLDKKYSNQELGIDLTAGIGGSYNRQNLDLSLNLKKNTTLIDKVQTPSLTGNNSVDMATVSQSECSNIMNEVQSSLEKFWEQNRSLLGQYY